MNEEVKQMENIRNNLDEFVNFARIQQEIITKLILFLRKMGIYYEFKNSLNIAEVLIFSELEEIVDGE